MDLGKINTITQICRKENVKLQDLLLAPSDFTYTYIKMNCNDRIRLLNRYTPPVSPEAYYLENGFDFNPEDPWLQCAATGQCTCPWEMCTCPWEVDDTKYDSNDDEVPSPVGSPPKPAMPLMHCGPPSPPVGFVYWPPPPTDSIWSPASPMQCEQQASPSPPPMAALAPPIQCEQQASPSPPKQRRLSLDGDNDISHVIK